VSDEPTLCSRLYTIFLPFRNLLRKLRRDATGRDVSAKDSKMYRYLKTAYFTLQPFVGASFLYFETLKNVVYTNIVYNTLYELSDGDITKYPFEMFLFIFMTGSIVLVQLLFIVYSVLYSNDIFEVSHAKDCHKFKTRLFFKFVAVILGPLMPTYVLANRVYYEARLDSERRELETFEKFCDEEKCIIDKDYKEKQLNKKIKVYTDLRQSEAKRNLFAKIYSYYRVISGVIESVTFTVVLVLLVFVTGRKGRDVNLIIGVEHRLRTFFDLTSYTGGILEELNLVRDFVIVVLIRMPGLHLTAGFSLLYSFFMAISAFMMYWIQAKSHSISVGGKVVLGMYFCCMLFNRLTTYISIFSITQPLQFDNGHENPKIGLLGGVTIFTVLITGPTLFYGSFHIKSTSTRKSISQIFLKFFVLKHLHEKLTQPKF